VHSQSYVGLLAIAAEVSLAHQDADDNASFEIADRWLIRCPHRHIVSPSGKT
jgi:hypothetical protein